MGSLGCYLASPIWQIMEVAPRRLGLGFFQAWLRRPQGVFEKGACGRPGYSLSGCFPAEPDSASPSEWIVKRRESIGNPCGRQSHALKIQSWKLESIAHYPKTG
jgi:hypothetical protein